VPKRKKKRPIIPNSFVREQRELSTTGVGGEKKSSKRKEHFKGKEQKVGVGRKGNVRCLQKQKRGV